MMSYCVYGGFPIAERTVYMSYVLPAMLHRSGSWCLVESEMGMLGGAERSTVKTVVLLISY